MQSHQGSRGGQRGPNLANFNSELLVEVFSHAPVRDALTALPRVCRQIRDVLGSPTKLYATLGADVFQTLVPRAGEDAEDNKERLESLSLMVFDCRNGHGERVEELQRALGRFKEALLLVGVESA
ncbi:hypothetical protein WJX81_002733 [Elliptochloris bilobata]|uniref:F-box domain-containing protein n=1 Tax=Elliptochloris bilobata TaxID=381761 RepID=A0AAW1SLH6_9CHLO